MENINPYQSIFRNHPKEVNKKQVKHSAYSLSFFQKYTLFVASVLYYTIYLPFRFQRETKENRIVFRVKTNIFQKIFCTINLTFMALTTSLFLYYGLESENNIKSRPNSMLQGSLMIAGVLLAVYYLCILKKQM